MEERRCVVIFNESTGRATGYIRQGEETIKELSFYLGRLHETEPSVAEDLIRTRYTDWAKINGVSEIQVEHIR